MIAKRSGAGLVLLLALLLAGLVLILGLSRAQDLLAVQRIAIAHDNSREIILLDVTSGQQQRIATNASQNPSLIWSPAGQAVAYVGFNSPTTDIFIYDTRHQGLSALTHDSNGTFSAHAPAWSADGEKLAYAWGSVFVDLSSNYRRLYGLHLRHPNGDIIATPHPRNVNIRRVQWSAGDFVLFVAQDEVGRLYIQHNGENAHLLAEDVGLFDLLPGGQAAIISDNSGQSLSRLHIADASRAPLNYEASLFGTIQDIAAAPDGEKFLLSTSAAALLLYRPDGGWQVLRRSPVSHMAWSADSQQVLFSPQSSAADGGAQGIFMYKVATGETSALYTAAPVRAFAPAPVVDAPWHGVALGLVAVCGVGLMLWRLALA